MTYFKLTNWFHKNVFCLLVVSSLAFATLLIPVHTAYASERDDLIRFSREQLGTEFEGHEQITKALILLLSTDPHLLGFVNESLAEAKLKNPDPKTNPAQDIDSYLDFIDEASKLLPQEILDNPPDLIRDQILQSICYFYFLVDQPISWYDPKAFGPRLQYYPEFAE